MYPKLRISLLALISAFFTIVGCTGTHTPYTTVEGFAQGGTFRLVYQPNANGETASLPDSLKIWFSRIDKSLSGYDTTSLVSQINRGENPPLDPLFIECFNLSKEVYQSTQGAFDISAAPFFDIWGFGFSNKGKITQHTLDSLMQFVGMDKLSIIYDSTANVSYLKKADPRMKVNFNAIAQGYTCDYICRGMDKMGIENYLLEVGGEILCKGINPKGKEWSIGIDKPIDGNFIPGQSVEAVIEVSNKGLVTSGNYRKFYIKDGKKYAHTIDPRTGYPVDHNLLSATIIASNAMLADAYATYCMVIGFEQAKTSVESRADLEGCLIYDDGGEFVTWCSAGLETRKAM